MTLYFGLLVVVICLLIRVPLAMANYSDDTRLLFAVSDHLGGKLARRDPMVHTPAVRRVGIRCRIARVVSLHRSVPGPAFANRKAQFEHAAKGCDRYAGDAVDRRVLDR